MSLTMHCAYSAKAVITTLVTTQIIQKCSNVGLFDLFHKTTVVAMSPTHSETGRSIWALLASH